MIVSDLAVSSSLLVATMDLNLVTSIIQAMRAADIGAAAASGSGSTFAAVGSSPKPAPTETIQRTVYVRNSEKPAATFEPCPPPSVHHWHTGWNDLQPYTCARPVLPTECKSSIQPPWRVLPWPIAAKPCLPPGYRMIKQQSNPADVIGVGRMLDLFV